MILAFAGDVFLGGDLERSALEDVLQVSSFQQADIRVVNLEQATADDITPEDKSTLYTNTRALDRLVDLGISAVSLANNHVHDLGPAGISKAKNALRSRGVGAFGAGETLVAALQPIELSPGVFCLAFCDAGQPYLQQVLTAAEGSPGVARLTESAVLESLDRLPSGARAVLMLHWGREHVWVPPVQDILLARRLLAHPKVALIIGNHAHRVQGIVRWGGKCAYMSVGNFLFPNFMMQPRTQLLSGASPTLGVPVTFGYHAVSRPTYKRWGNVARTSLVVLFDAETGIASHRVAVQDADSPVVRDASPLHAAAYGALVWLLSLVCAAPDTLLRISSAFEARRVALVRFLQWRRYQLRQEGPGVIWRGLKRRIVGGAS